ncbi:hypothetical protein [Mesorhizobium sp. f-mel]
MGAFVFEEEEFALDLRLDLRQNAEYERTATAYHEAGHAVIAWLYGLSFDRVTIVRDGDVADCVYYSPTDHLAKPMRWWTRWRNSLAYSSAGGPIAEAIWLGKPYDNDGVLNWQASFLFSPTDFEGVMDRDGAAFLHPRSQAMYEIMKGRADVWSAVVGLAESLLELGTVTGDDADRLIRKHIPNGRTAGGRERMTSIAANDNDALVLTRPQAAALCRVCPSTFDTWVRKGVVPGSMTGTRRWSRVALERALCGDLTPPAADNDNTSPFEAWKRQHARSA